ncbi:hypothetical protein CH06BL_12410 [Chromobacterium haemolyticum]|nr:hypothetical protein CH06BL_12410 [Chromobacterium haemolyticum]
MAADTLWKQRIRDGSTIQETNPERRDCCGAGAIVGEEREGVKPAGSLGALNGCKSLANTPFDVLTA